MYVDGCVSVVDLQIQTCWKNYKSIHRIKHLQDNTYYLLEPVVVASIWYCSTVPTHFCSWKSFPWIVGELTRAWSNSPRSFEWSGDRDEASKYVKFLQAQVQVLEHMPSSPSALHSKDRGELLQALVTSPTIQRKLFREQKCVGTVEQYQMLATTTGSSK